MEYSLIVVELDDVVTRRDPDKPNLYVAISISSLENRYSFLLSGGGPKWITGHIKSLRNDLCFEFFTTDYQCAQSYKSAIISSLQSDGYTVNRNTDVWRVYVIELDPSAVNDPGLGYVYVGESKKNPEQRFKEHVNRSRNGRTRLFSSVVANHGLRLRMDLAPASPCFDKQSSKRAESEWAVHLRSLGYVVRGGH